ncbi:hypothetical protein AAEP80_11120 [Curtobacterium sp. L3-7]|uniref:hypothetical protein n=1 Tax=Curtobacterium sp. L3-7 TaxID=3138787 RepID=UPI003B51F602
MEVGLSGNGNHATGKHALLLGAVLLAQLASNFVLPGLGLVFLGLLFVPAWFGARTDRIVLAIGAVLSAAYLAVALIDGISGPAVGFQLS